MTKIAMTDEQLDEVNGGIRIPYVIQAGDTLAKIAEKYHCSVEDLCAWNGIKNPNLIAVNQKLVIKF